MVVSLKTSKEAGYNVMSLLGVAPALASKAQQAGVEVQQTTPGNFTIGKDSQVYGSVTAKGAALTLAAAGNLGPASKESLKFQFEQALTAALTALNDQTAGLATSSPHVMAPTKAQSASPASLLGAAVKLIHATELGQIVLGTSASSKYVMIAKFAGLNLAIRSKGSTLSFRVEGPAISSYQSRLDELGFSVKGDYASAHFDVVEQAMALKTVGAIIGRIGFSHLEGVTDATPFLNQGA